MHLVLLSNSLYSNGRSGKRHKLPRILQTESDVKQVYKLSIINCNYQCCVLKESHYHLCKSPREGASPKCTNPLKSAQCESALPSCLDLLHIEVLLLHLLFLHLGGDLLCISLLPQRSPHGSESEQFQRAGWCEKS